MVDAAGSDPSSPRPEAVEHGRTAVVLRGPGLLDPASGSTMPTTLAWAGGRLVARDSAAESLPHTREPIDIPDDALRRRRKAGGGVEVDGARRYGPVAVIGRCSIGSRVRERLRGAVAGDEPAAAPRASWAVGVLAAGSAGSDRGGRRPSARARPLPAAARTGRCPGGVDHHAQTSPPSTMRDWPVHSSHAGPRGMRRRRRRRRAFRSGRAGGCPLGVGGTRRAPAAGPAARGPRRAPSSAPCR